MFRRLFTLKYFQNAYRCYCTKYGNVASKLLPVVNTTPLVLATRFCSQFIIPDDLQTEADPNSNAEDIESELEYTFRQACIQGDAAILELMHQLKDLVMNASVEYQTCISKQIELIKNDSNVDVILSDTDEIPEYRIVTDALCKEIEEYYILFKMIGDVARNQSLLTTDGLDFERLEKTYKQLEKLVLVEYEKNQKLEGDLLKAQCENIRKS